MIVIPSHRSEDHSASPRNQRTRWSTILLRTVTLLALAGVGHLLHLQSASAAKTTDVSEVFYLPNGRALRPLTLGQHTSVADLYWLRFVQYVGTPGDYSKPQILEFVQLITDLDPDYSFAYMAGGLLLSERKRIAESNAILEKGARNAPNRWEIPFYLAFNYWYELGDLEQGAKWLDRAARIPGAPPLVIGLASRLYSSAGRMDAAIAFMARIAEDAPTPERRKVLEEQLLGLRIERDLQHLEQGIATFQLRFGTAPRSLEDLANVMDEIPRDPTGRPYDYDSSTGRVSSKALGKRIALPSIPKPEIRIKD